MIHRAFFVIPLLSLALPGSVLGDGSVPNYSSCSDAESAAFDSGRATGRSEGYNEGYPVGYNDGTAAMLNTCQVDPVSCGITISTLTPDPTYGETEPNDNIVSADYLELDVTYWGQSYGPSDEDWYYVVTSEQNTTLALFFEVPNSSISGWQITVRDAAGNVFTRFDTGAVPGASNGDGSITYRMTMGLAGTYYIVVQPVGNSTNYDSYNLSASLEQSPSDSENYVVGFYDVEVEPNDYPSAATVLVSGVAMYGIINLAFEEGAVVKDVGGDGYEYSQGYDVDWYLYPTDGNEVINMSVCAYEECTTGNWLFQVYDESGAYQVASGSSSYVAPLLAYNSDTGSPDEVSFGISEGGNYYLKVTHKRLLTAVCSSYTLDTVEGGACSCAEGESSCEVETVLQGEDEGLIKVQTGGDADNPVYTYYCPDGSAGTVLNPPPDTGDGTTTTTAAAAGDEETGEYGDTVRCTVSCGCNSFSGVIEVPADALTSQYNFTWQSTEIAPNTSDSDAYDDYQSRPSPY